jgi:CRP/FNR family cyclic AMP-dependent transcriptional regulator
MSFPRIIFRIVENRNCPLYQYGDCFELSGVALPLSSNKRNSVITTAVITFPTEKKICKMLNGDLAKLVIQYERGDKIPACLLNCSGCTGSMKIEHSKDYHLPEHSGDTITDEFGPMMHLFSSFPFFKNIEGKHLDKVLSYFNLKKYKPGAIVISKGDPGGRFFIIVSGKVNVLNEAGIIISTLDKGEVFGEMSLICNDYVSATIQIKEPSSILYIDRPSFQKVVDMYPAIQLYFSRLMAERLNKSNKVRAEDLSSGIIGNFSEIPPEALFQTLNMNNKTGILTISDLSHGTARFSFRQGALIKAKYGDYAGDIAFYQILKENSGRFRFTPGIAPEDFNTPEIGFFMKLLMEGMRRLDEAKGQNTN